MIFQKYESLLLLIHVNLSKWDQILCDATVFEIHADAHFLSFPSLLFSWNYIQLGNIHGNTADVFMYRFSLSDCILHSAANKNHAMARRVLMKRYFRLPEATVCSFIHSNGIILLINIYSASSRCLAHCCRHLGYINEQSKLKSLFLKCTFC